MQRREAIRKTGAAALALSSLPAWGAQSPTIGQRIIPSSGESIPCVGLGTWLTFDINQTDRGAMAQRQSVVRELLRYRGAVIDSSPMYGQSEQIVGRVVEKLQKADDLFLASKVWTHGDAHGANQMRSTSEKMGKPVMDLLQIHNLMDWKTHMRTLQAMKERGEVEYIGITHYLSHAYDQMEQILKAYPIDFIQVNYNITAPESGDRLLPAAKDHGKAVIINRPFAGGNVFRKVKDKALPAVAKDLGCNSWAQLILKYVLSNPAVTCAIPGTRQPGHMRENAIAGSGNLPSESQRRAIVSAFLS